MKQDLRKLRDLLEDRPRLAGGKFWMYLGGLHMNIHKLMENVLLECETFLGAALLFPDADVVRMAEQNLEGCYAKRQLEAAKFLWVDGLMLAKKGNWGEAETVLLRAAGKKNGWGWGVNNGDIWIVLSAVQAILALQGALAVEARQAVQVLSDSEQWITAQEFLRLAAER